MEQVRQYQSLNALLKEVQRVADEKKVAGINFDLYHPGRLTCEELMEAGGALLSLLQKIPAGAEITEIPFRLAVQIDPSKLEDVAEMVLEKYKEIYFTTTLVDHSPRGVWPAVNTRVMGDVILQNAGMIFDKLFPDSECGEYFKGYGYESVPDDNISPFISITVLQQGRCLGYIDAEIFRIYSHVYFLHNLLHGVLLQPMSIGETEDVLNTLSLSQILKEEEAGPTKGYIQDGDDAHGGLADDLLERYRTTESNVRSLTRYLLVPRESLAKHWEKTGYDLAKLRETYTVPLGMLFSRLRELEITDIYSPEFIKQAEDLLAIKER